MCIDDIVAHMHTALVDKMGVCVNGTKITVLKYALCRRSSTASI